SRDDLDAGAVEPVLEPAGRSVRKHDLDLVAHAVPRVRVEDARVRGRPGANEAGEVEGEEARDDRLEVGEAAAGRVVVAQWWNRRRRLEPEPSGVVDLGAGVRRRGASVLHAP